MKTKTFTQFLMILSAFLLLAFTVNAQTVIQIEAGEDVISGAFLEAFSGDIIELTTRWKKAVVELDNILYDDAKKEFAATAQIGYGLDGDEKTKHSDFAAVRGTFEEDSFVSEIEQHITSKTALGDELISRMENLHQQPHLTRRNA